MPAFLLASRKLAPPLPLWQQPHSKQHDAAAEAAVAAAAAALPGALVVPARVLLQQRCAAALEQQSPVDEDLKGAERHVMGLGASLEQQGLGQSLAR
jgi:hypothetical protein